MAAGPVVDGVLRVSLRDLYGPTLVEAKPRPDKFADVVMEVGDHTWIMLHPMRQYHLLKTDLVDDFLDPEPDPELPPEMNRPGYNAPPSYLVAHTRKDGSLAPDSGWEDPGRQKIMELFFGTVFELCAHVNSWVDVNWFLDHYMNQLSGKINPKYYPKIIDAIKRGLIRANGKKIPWPKGSTGGPVGVTYAGLDSDDREFSVKAIFHDVGDLVLGNRAFSVRLDASGNVTEFRKNSLSPYAMLEAFEEWDGEELATALEMVGAKGIAARFKVDRDEHEANGSILPKTIAAMQSPVKTQFESSTRMKQARAHLLEMRRRDKWRS